jgi:hypothetical protein
MLTPASLRIASLLLPLAWLGCTPEERPFPQGAGGEGSSAGSGDAGNPGTGGSGASSGGGGSDGGGTANPCTFSKTGELQTTVPSYVDGIVVVGNSLYLSTGSTVPVTVYRVSPDDGAFISSFSAQSQIHTSLAASPTKLYLDQIAVGTDVIFEIDRANPGDFSTFPNPVAEPRGDLAFLEGSLWAFGAVPESAGKARLSMLQIGTGAVMRSFALPDNVGQTLPVSLGSDGVDLLYVSNDPTCPDCGPTLFIFSTSGEVRCHQQLKGLTDLPNDIASDGARLLYTTNGSGRVSIFERR